MKNIAWGLLLATSLLLAASAEAQQQKGGQEQSKVYRWVDENGEVHFGESPPPELQEKNLEVQKRTGNTWGTDKALEPVPQPKPKAPEKGELPRDSSGLVRPAPRYTPEQLKIQQDALLLLSYDSEQEIVDAMNVEIKQLDYDRRTLTTSRKSLLEAYQGNIREAAERQRAGIRVEDQLVKQIISLKQRLAANQSSIAGLKAREEAIRKSFEAQLDRYRTLVAEQKEAEQQVE